MYHSYTWLPKPLLRIESSCPILHHAAPLRMTKLSANADVRVERLVRPAEVLDQLLEDREALPLQRQIGALDAPLQQPPQRRVEQRQVVGVRS